LRTKGHGGGGDRIARQNKNQHSSTVKMEEIYSPENVDGRYQSTGVKFIIIIIIIIIIL
jgi:hypothetical protein